MKLQLSTIYDFFDKVDQREYEMKARYSDVYEFSFKNVKVTLKNELGKEIFTSVNSFSYKLNKDEIIKIIVNKVKANKINVKIIPSNHKVEYPYDPLDVDTLKGLDLDETNSYDILKEATIKAIKRDDKEGLYINCNNPEKIFEEDLNKRLSVQQIKNKKVFFTFEHNNIDKPVYYGYRLYNNSNKDAFVTILNMGFQLDGAGCWLGEKEWVDFYNSNFRYDGSKFSDIQKQEFIDYYNFSNKYKSPNTHPITYRIPKGKYIYIMGGTSIDAYKHINVLNTANKLVNGGCSNCACLFDVVGNVEGSFIVYEDYKKIDNNSHNGYVISRPGHENLGAQLLGYDTCHGVIDTFISYSFNDLTKNQQLPVTFTNHYNESYPEKGGTPYEKIDVKAHKQHLKYWVTNCSALSNHDAVGTDMTRYITIDHDSKKEICIDDYHYDGRGCYPNIGNWMADYMDYYTFVNKGNKTRTITIKMTCTGSICVLVKDFNNKLLKKPVYAIYHRGSKGEEYSIYNPFELKVKVKPNEIKKIIVEYNLLANSCGYIPHYITLG